jgi:hypothetical protein
MGPQEGKLPAGAVTVPADVVRRAFGEETVVLNLATGQYHGLNGTAARMLELLEEHGTAQATAQRVATEFGVPLDVASRDLAELCAALEQRGLIAVDGEG